MITTAIIAAAETRTARDALASVDWAALPDTLCTLGWTPNPRLLAALHAPTTLGEVFDLRREMSRMGDRALRARGEYARKVADICAEVVGLTGARLALLDA